MYWCPVRQDVIAFGETYLCLTIQAVQALSSFSVQADLIEETLKKKLPSSTR